MARTIRKPGYSAEHESWFITLTQDVIALVDPAWVPVFSQHNWCASQQRRRWRALRDAKLPNGGWSMELMHRVVMDAPIGMEVDHRKHHPVSMKLIDNRKANLRLCTPRQNQINKRPQAGTRSIFKGVTWHKENGTWRARIRVGGKHKHLGLFATEKEAALAYDAAAIEHHGEYALTNHDMGFL